MPRSFMTCTTTQYCSGNQMKKNEMGGACMGEGEVRIGFCWGDLSEGDHLEDTGIFRRIILKEIFKKRDGDTDWIDLAQDKER